MVVTRLSGGRQNFRVEWRGATVLEAWKQQIGTGVQEVAQGILGDLHSSIHVVSGDMRAAAFAEVDVSGTKRTIRAGSSVDYAIFEEIYHPQIRGVIDRWAPKLTQRIAAARRAG